MMDSAAREGRPANASILARLMETSQKCGHPECES